MARFDVAPGFCGSQAPAGGVLVASKFAVTVILPVGRGGSAALGSVMSESELEYEPSGAAA